MTVQQIEEAMGVLLDTQFASGPGGKRDVLLKVFYLEPIFNIEG